jgi:diaminopimelate epimerase
MGEPRFASELIPTTLLETQEITVTDDQGEHLEQAVVQAAIQAVVQGEQVSYSVTCVNMGNPHAVIFLDYLDAETKKAFLQNPLSFDLDNPGAYLEGNRQYFPEKTNVEFAALSSKNRIKMRVYERGVGETLACGTGACATAIAAVLLGNVDRQETIAVELLGGTLEVNWQADNHIKMRGPATTVFKGAVEI